MYNSTNKFQLGITKQKPMIWNDDFSLISYFKQYNLYLNFYYDNIFLKLNIDSVKVKDKFYAMNTYNDSLFSNDLAVKIKLLSDTFTKQLPKTVFGITDIDGNVKLTKGHKKLYAYAMNGRTHGHIISLTKIPTEFTIEHDDDLYAQLKSIDPTTETYRVNLGNDNDLPNIQFLENVDTIYKWGDQVDQNTILNMIEYNSKIKISIDGDLKYVDKKINVASKKESNCHVIVKGPKFLSLQDILFNSYNLYHNKPTSKLIGKSIIINYKQPGITIYNKLGF